MTRYEASIGITLFIAGLVSLLVIPTIMMIIAKRKRRS